MVSRAASLILRRRESSDSASQIRSATFSGERISESKPFSPSRRTSWTGGVAEETRQQPTDMDCIKDQERTKGSVR